MLKPNYNSLYCNSVLLILLLLLVIIISNKLIIHQFKFRITIILNTSNPLKPFGLMIVLVVFGA